MKVAFILIMTLGASLAGAVTVHRIFQNLQNIRFAPGWNPRRKGQSNERIAPEPKTFVPVEGADHNDFIGVLGLYEYKKLLLKMAKIGI